jgi:hypothetical protein
MPPHLSTETRIPKDGRRDEKDYNRAGEDE